MIKEKVGSYIAVSRIDGRAGARVFGLKPSMAKQFKGTLFRVGDALIPVQSDGRINIPKDVMNAIGTTGTDGRKRVTITYTSATERDGTRKFSAFINKPLAKDKNRKTGWKVTKPRQKTKRGLKPSDSGDYTWSPM